MTPTSFEQLGQQCKEMSIRLMDGETVNTGYGLSDDFERKWVSWLMASINADKIGRPVETFTERQRYDLMCLAFEEFCAWWKRGHPDNLEWLSRSSDRISKNLTQLVAWIKNEDGRYDGIFFDAEQSLDFVTNDANEIIKVLESLRPEIIAISRDRNL